MRGRLPGPWLALTVVSLALILSATFVFWRVETWPARTAADVAQVFQDTLQFQPRVTVDNQVVVEDTQPVSELAVSESRVVVERNYENRWLLSTKRLQVRGTYLAKAGFDLQKNVDVSLDTQARTLAVRFPAPELLALDQERVEFLKWDNGLWNRLNGDNTEEAVNDLRTEAGRRVAEQDLLTQAKQSVEDRLVPALEANTGLDVSVTFSS